MPSEDEHPVDDGAATTPRRAGFLRRHKALAILVALALVLIAAVGGWLWQLNSGLSDISRFDADLDRPDRPDPVQVDGKEPVNIVIAGVDDGKGTELEAALRADTWPAGTFRSDTIMVLHLSAEQQQAQLISIPRDSWVSVPGHGTDKINAAFSYGGPALLTHTIEKLTGVRIDHAVVMDWEGFDGITDAVGGVDVTDENGQTTHLQGKAALEYVRERKSLPRGDFSRIQRQQNFMRAVFKKLLSAGVMRNPVEVTNLVGTLADFVAVDQTLDNGRMRSLALDHRDVRPGDLDFLTIPTLGTGTSSTGASIVRVDRPAVRELFDAVARDDYASWEGKHQPDELPTESQVP